MTLDEHIWEEEKFAKSFAKVSYDAKLHDENGKLMWLAEQYEKSQHEHEERKALLEELKTLRVELEENSKELEVYKKAFELACWDLDSYLDNYTDTHYDIFTLMNEYLQKARAQE